MLYPDSMKIILCLFSILACLVLSAKESLLPPNELNQWTEWILDEHHEIQCLPLGTEAEKRQCAWPGKLKIDINSTSATFEQGWQVYSESWIVLPGNQEHWPIDVLVNEKPFNLLEHNGYPALRLPIGKHRITGKFTWSQMPQYLQIAENTALIEVAIAGERQRWPNIDSKARLYLKDSITTDVNAEKNNRVDVEVFRKLIDGVPVSMETILNLKVSGKPRELQLGRFLLANNEVMRISSPLPARIEDNGDLRIQVRAGNWTVSVHSRFTENPEQLAMERSSKDWPTQELWSFAAAPSIRGVKLEGAPSIDPSQLSLPDAWKKLPTYLIETDSLLTLQEEYRGDVAPSGNQIRNTRTLWLDFDGTEATVKDTLNGVMHQDWRLTTHPEMRLGRATVNGIPQLVTRMNESDNAGVEIRQHNFSLESLSRLENWHTFSATGWQHDMASLDMNVNLPPGWRLWHATGADSVSYSWISRWDLWDLFICFLIVGSMFKLLGTPTALLALLTMILTYHENNAPVWTWMFLILIVSLLRVLPQGRFRSIVNIIGYFVVSCLLIIGLIFAIQQIRKGIYPQLEYTHTIYTSHHQNKQSARYVVQEEHPIARASSVEYDLEGTDTYGDFLHKSRSGYRKSNKAQRYQQNIQTQTGPGEPTWRWQTARLYWSGPVTRDTQLRFYLTPPWVTRLLMFIQTLLLSALIFVLTRELFRNTRSSNTSDKPPRTAPSSSHPVTAVLCLICSFVGLSSSEVQAQSFPPEYLLEKWEERLLRKPECAPHCLALNQVRITVENEKMLVRMRADTGTQLALPIPTHTTWRIEKIEINGLENENLMRDGQLQWLPLNEGINEVVLHVAINSDTIVLPFTITPHNVEVDAGNWDVLGLVNQRVPSKSLQFEKREKSAEKDSLLPAPIKPFVKVDRHIVLDQDWTIHTTVRRLAPQAGAVAVNIPLLKGESVVSEISPIIEQGEQRLVPVTLAAKQHSASWDSVLNPVKRIKLKGMDNSNFVESWSVEASPFWHIRTSGLTPVKNNQEHAPFTYRWLPWPGEQVTIETDRPIAVPGPTTTVESIALKAQPGARSTRLEATIQIHTSMGSDFRIEAPIGAELERVEIDNVKIPQQEDNNIVTLPLNPGQQTATILWSIPQGVAFKTSTPHLTLSTEPNNIQLKLTFPRSRWPLLVSGPDIGPAMLYWGVLLVMLFVAVCLGQIVRRFKLNIPLQTRHWILLMLGMSTVNLLGILPVIVWFFAMDARARLKQGLTRHHFNLMQVGLIVISIIAAFCLFATIPQSLLSTPDMQVEGNGSYNYLYQWYQDNSGVSLPQGHVYSLPIEYYRIAMLAWSLWLAFVLLRWARWSWQCFSHKRLWYSKKDTPLPHESD